MHRTLNFWLRSTIIVFFWHFLGILLIRPVSIIPRLMNSIFLDRIYQIPPGNAKPFKILPLVSFQKFHSVTLKTMIFETLPPFCPSVVLIWFWAPGPLGEPQVHHQPGTFEINAVICRQKHHKKQECGYGEPCFFSGDFFPPPNHFTQGCFPDHPTLVTLTLTRDLLQSHCSKHSASTSSPRFSPKDFC